MNEHKSFPKRMQDIVNTYIKQEQSAHSPSENTADQQQETAPSEQHPTAGDSAALEQRIVELEEQLATVTAERDELREKYVRTLAEMDNLRKRTEREKDQLVLFATERLFSRLVEILDDLQAAVEAGKQSRDYDAMLNGLEMITTKAHRIYEEHGVRPLEAREGEPFNVELHEALVHVPHPELPEGTIVQQVQRGYVFRDRVLRHARVVTSAGAHAADGASSEQSPSSQSD
ncbi:MAG: protein GrpE [Candidatus Kapaibacterium sp.]|nr:MAG: protein GrpE [Candidatus Kapabacteria bacterium]